MSDRKSSSIKKKLFRLNNAMSVHSISTKRINNADITESPLPNCLLLLENKQVTRCITQVIDISNVKCLVNAYGNRHARYCKRQQVSAG